MTPMFSIIIVDWELPQLTQKCIDSIRNNSVYKHEIIIVNNEAKHCDLYFIPDFGIHIYNKANLGLSKAANQGAKKASTDYICLIDNDIEVTRDWDLNLFGARMSTKSNWVCSTRIEPNPSNTNAKSLNGYDPEKHGWYRQISNTPLLIPKKFWDKIGGYDEDFFVIGAELGLAKRAYDHGVRDFVQTPRSVVLHKESQSTGKLPNIKKHRQDRDRIFKDKYGMNKRDFTKLIGKGTRFD